MKSIKKIALRVTREKLEDDALGKVVRSSRDVRAIAAALIGQEDQEVVLAFHLDVRNRVIGYHEVSRGSVSGAYVEPREVFRAAIVNGASGIILSHNHPSGDCAPSDEDNAFTGRIVTAGKLLGIQVLDHVVVAADGYFSYLDAGLLAGVARRHALTEAA